MNQTEADQKMRKTLNDKYKKQVNELLHWDINVIDWEIIITKWWWSNNRLVFHTEDELQTYINGLEWSHLSPQWFKYKEDFKYIIDKCDYYIKEIRISPEYFSDDWDYDISTAFQSIKDTLSKYVN